MSSIKPIRDPKTDHLLMFSYPLIGYQAFKIGRAHV